MLLNLKKKLPLSFKSRIKFIIDLIICFFDIIIIIFSIKKIKNKIFFVQIEGGFGPSVTSSHLLNLDFKSNWILLFGTKKDRHNKKISKIFDEKIKFFRCGSLNSTKNQEQFYRYIKKYLFLFFKINLRRTDEYIQNFDWQDPESKTADKDFLSLKKRLLFESCFFFKKRRDEISYSNNEYKKKFSEKFKKFENNFKGRANFFLRGKGRKYPNNRFIDNIRDSRDINDYKLSIECLVDNNWQIFLTGEMFDIPDWLKKMNNSIIYLKKTNLTLDDYNLYVLMNSDIYIGGSSGPPIFNCVSNCKNLLLETCHLGIAYLDTVVSYPKIKFDNLDELKEIFLKSPFDDQFLNKIFEQKKIERLSSKELQLITNEFIYNYNDDAYWKTSKDLGFLRTQIYYLDAKISNSWLKLNNIKV